MTVRQVTSKFKEKKSGRENIKACVIGNVFLHIGISAKN